MAMKIGREFWLCEDCTMYAVNDDLTGIDYYLSGEAADKRAEQVRKGVHKLGPHLSPNWDSETDEGIREFSSQPCDACGTRLAGSRHRFVTLVPLTKTEERDLAKMKDLLKDHGYDPGFAHDFLDEGMKPAELEDSLRREPGSYGSLEYTHEIRRGQRSKYA